MTNERIYVISGTMMDGSEIVATYTSDANMAQSEYLQLVAIDMQSVYISDANTGEIYAYFNCSCNSWGVEIDRGVSREFTEILAGLRI